MDITKELLEINSSKDAGASLYQDIKRQQEELLQKRHIVQILCAATEIEILIAEGFFEKDKVKFLTISGDQDYNGNCRIVFDGLDKDQEYAMGATADYYERLFENIFKYKELDVFLTDIDFNTDNYNLELVPGITEKILEILLSADLKKVYDYNKMQLEMPSNNKNNEKKLKI